jgi:hypothetical protein
MRVWLACFLVLFALAQLFDWLKQFHLPLPIYILGGAFLAVASNYDKLFGSNVSSGDGIVPSPQPQLDSSSQPTASISFADIEGQQPLAFSRRSKELPQSQTQDQ